MDAMQQETSHHHKSLTYGRFENNGHVEAAEVHPKCQGAGGENDPNAAVRITQLAKDPLFRVLAIVVDTRVEVGNGVIVHMDWRFLVEQQPPLEHSLEPGSKATRNKVNRWQSG
jgi:hypothetical protein